MDELPKRPIKTIYNTTMHELSLLNEIVKTVEKHSAGEMFCDESIESLTLQVGELNSAVPEYLKSMWGDAVSGTLLDGAELIIESVPAVAMCKDCGLEFKFKETRGICPNCDSKNVALKSGREFYIKEIAVSEKTSTETV